MHAFVRQTDRQTDRETEFPSLYRDCIPCSAVKIGLRLSVCLSRSHFLIDIHENWHNVTYVSTLIRRTSSLGVNIAPPIPLFPPTEIKQSKKVIRRMVFCYSFNCTLLPITICNYSSRLTLTTDKTCTEY